MQIGNAINEKKVLDVLLAARDRGLYNAVTDCGAGGFSSAVGEMGEKIGAEVQLDRAPLKYEGLSYTEIWITEAQERMVLAVPDDKWPALRQTVRSRRRRSHGHRPVRPHRPPAAELPRHASRRSRHAVPAQRPPAGRPPSHLSTAPSREPIAAARVAADYTADLLRILASPNVASKEWIIRQYDHEVQGGSVVKPLVGVERRRPERRRRRAARARLAPRHRDRLRHESALRRLRPLPHGRQRDRRSGPQLRRRRRRSARIAILDNFCWGNCERPETLGSLVRAALACHDLSLALGTPFISGKDSLNNEFSYTDASRPAPHDRHPAVAAHQRLGQIDDVVALRHDGPQAARQPALPRRRNQGRTRRLALRLVNNLAGGQVPQVDPEIARNARSPPSTARSTPAWSRACHDLSEGGLAVAAAEMAFAGGLGADFNLVLRQSA